MNKRTGLRFAVALLWVSCLLVSCTGKTDTQASAAGDAGAAAQTGTREENAAPENTYAFYTDGIWLYPDMDITVLPESLGEPEGRFEEESCAALGIAKLYAFADYEIYTYPDGDTDRIQYIYLKTDRVQTAEGADLSTDRDTLQTIYGAGNPDGDALVYARGAMRLVFVMGDDGYPRAIEYRSDVMQ